MFKDLQNYQNKIAQFQEAYKNGFQGENAGHTLEQTLAFNQRELTPLRAKYANLPQAAGYIAKQGSALALANVQAMQAYGKKQHQAHKTAIHNNELEIARTRLSDWRTSPEERQSIRTDLERKTRAFYGNYDQDQTGQVAGQLPDQQAGQPTQPLAQQLAQLDEYFKNCLGQAQQNRLEQLRQSDPQEALRLLENALAVHGEPQSAEPDNTQSEQDELATHLLPHQLQTELEKTRLAVAWQQTQKHWKLVDDTYAGLRESINFLPLEQQAELALAQIEKITDPELRENTRRLFTSDHAAAKISQASSDAKFRQEFLTSVQNEKLTPSQALLQLQLANGPSLKTRQRISNEIMGDHIQETPDNTRQLDTLRSLVDRNKINSAEALEAFAFDAGLTDAQTSKARRYYAAGNNANAEGDTPRQLKMSTVDTALKSLGHGQTLADLPGFFDIVANNLEPGKFATEQNVRKTVAELLTDGFAAAMSMGAAYNNESPVYETQNSAFQNSEFPNNELSVPKAIDPATDNNNAASLPADVVDEQQLTAALGLPEGSTLLAAAKNRKTSDAPAGKTSAQAKTQGPTGKTAKTAQPLITETAKPTNAEALLNPLAQINYAATDDEARQKAQQRAEAHLEKLTTLSREKDASPAVKQAAAVSEILEPLLKNTRAQQAHEYDTETLYAQIKQCVTESKLSESDKKFALSYPAKPNGLLLNLRYAEKKARLAHYENDKKTFLDELTGKNPDAANLQANVDGFMEGKYKKAYGDPDVRGEWKLNIANDKYYPERSKLMLHVLTAKADTMLTSKEGAEQLLTALTQLNPEVDVEAWGKKQWFKREGKRDHDREGLSKKLIEQVRKHADKHGVPLMLALGVLSQESNGFVDAKSPAAIDDPKKGALGPMQVQENLFTDLKNYYPHIKNYSRADVDQNIELGILGLRLGLERFNGDWVKTMAAYNQGGNAVAGLNDDLSVPDWQTKTPKTNDEAKELAVKKRASILARKYVDETTQYLTERQAGFVIPQPNIWNYLSPELRSKYLRQAEKKSQND